MFCVGILGILGHPGRRTGRRTGPTCFTRAFLCLQFVLGGRRHVLYGGIKTDMVVVLVVCGGGFAVSATRRGRLQWTRGGPTVFLVVVTGITALVGGDGGGGGERSGGEKLFPFVVVAVGSVVWGGGVGGLGGVTSAFGALGALGALGAVFVVFVFFAFAALALALALAVVQRP